MWTEQQPLTAGGTVLIVQNPEETEFTGVYIQILHNQNQPGCGGRK